MVLKPIKLSKNMKPLSGDEPSEIVILLPKNQMGAEAVRFSQEHGIDTNHVFVTNKDRKWRNKRISQVNDHRLKISTIHQFKGWESANVILLLPEHWNGADKNMGSVVYTAMTRTLKNLIVLNCNKRYSDFEVLLD